MHYTYVMFNWTVNKFYIGSTNDLKRRVLEHKRGNTFTTSKSGKWDLVYYEACLSSKDSKAREKQLKTGFGRGYLRRRLTNYLRP